MRSRVAAFAAIGALWACFQHAPLDGAGGAGASASSASTSVGGSGGSFNLPECGAQRVVHLMGSQGGLAWFTLLWPAPSAVLSKDPNHAIDDRTRFVDLGTAAHPLFVRRRGLAPVWSGTGTQPHPSVFVVGTNETHSATPSTAITLMGRSIIGQSALHQSSLMPKITVLTFDPAPYAAVPNGPTAVNVNGVDAAIDALTKMKAISAAEAESLRADPSISSTWHSPGAPNKITSLAQQLLFTARLFERGLVATVVIPALRDDPHGAFAQLAETTTTADDLSGILDGFFGELAKATEKSCGYKSAPLSLADNVVVVVSGDTPKNSFDKAGWPDGTPGNANLLYVRGNGWTVPGWFGEITPAGKTNFDPKTGALAKTTDAASLAAALSGVLYAVTRGNGMAVGELNPGPYGGVVSQPP